MNVTCEKRDQDLFFLSQNLLSTLGAVWLGLHVQRCSSCRARVEQFSSAAVALRRALGAPEQVRRTALPLRKAMLITAVFILLAAMGFAAYTALAADPDPPSAPAVSCGDGVSQLPAVMPKGKGKGRVSK